MNFPPSRRIHYGQYQRADLIEATRRSRACAYLADDDHGPLALQEIMLAGCPAVGIRTGASLVLDGVTGYWVDRLPPGEPATSDRDSSLLATYLLRISTAMELDRCQVQRHANEAFSVHRIVLSILKRFEASQLTSFPGTCRGANLGKMQKIRSVSLRQILQDTLFLADWLTIAIQVTLAQWSQKTCKIPVPRRSSP